MVREGDPHAGTKAKAYALRTAYRLAPEGFQHIAGGTQEVLMN
jgi:hypothetical protein